MTSGLPTDADPQPPAPFVRTFVAIEISDTARQALAELQSRLKKVSAHVSWVPPANLHLSLAFLGDVQRSHVPLLGMALDVPVSHVVLMQSTLSPAGAQYTPLHLAHLPD